jgi:serine/threonine protein kinase
MYWVYNNENINNISQFSENTYGFVYRITHKPTNKSYIGKKVLYYERNKKLGKKELEILKEERKGTPGRLPTKKKVITESNWKVYWGSNKELIELSKNEPYEDFEREILQVCNSKKLLTYYETKYLFMLQVLEFPDNYFNDNILGKFYTKDLE